jgi:hypothetical protein
MTIAPISNATARTIAMFRVESHRDTVGVATGAAGAGSLVAGKLAGMMGCTIS